MCEGDFFGGRCLLTVDEMKSQEDFRANCILKPGPSRLTLVLVSNFPYLQIADAAEVEILELSPDNFTYIPDFLRLQLKKGIKSMKDFDDIEIDKELKKLEYWENFKTKQTNEIYKSKSVGSGTNYKRY